MWKLLLLSEVFFSQHNSGPEFCCYLRFQFLGGDVKRVPKNAWRSLKLHEKRKISMGRRMRLEPGIESRMKRLWGIPRGVSRAQISWEASLGEPGNLSSLLRWEGVPKSLLPSVLLLQHSNPSEKNLPGGISTQKRVSANLKWD